MDEETSSRIRQIIKDAVERQRPPADTDATKRQMIVTTLRLAGHTVELAPGFPALSNAADPPDATARADRADGSDETTPDETPGTGNPLIHDALDRFNDPTRPADYGKAQLLPDIINHPTKAQPYRVLSDVAVGDGMQVLAHDEESDASSSGLEITPADGNGFSPSFSDPTAADPSLDDGARPALSIVSDDDFADFDPPPSAGEDSGDDGGVSQSSGSESASNDGPAPDGQPAIVVQPTEILTEQLVKAAAEGVSPLAQKAVDAGMSDLRHEMYVSRAAWNALFPR